MKKAKPEVKENVHQIPISSFYKSLEHKEKKIKEFLRREGVDK